MLIAVALLICLLTWLFHLFVTLFVFMNYYMIQSKGNGTPVGNNNLSSYT